MFFRNHCLQSAHDCRIEAANQQQLLRQVTRLASRLGLWVVLRMSRARSPESNHKTFLQSSSSPPLSAFGRPNQRPRLFWAPPPAPSSLPVQLMTYFLASLSLARSECHTAGQSQVSRPRRRRRKPFQDDSGISAADGARLQIAAPAMRGRFMKNRTCEIRTGNDNML